MWARALSLDNQDRPSQRPLSLRGKEAHLDLHLLWAITRLRPHAHARTPCLAWRHDSCRQVHTTQRCHRALAPTASTQRWACKLIQQNGATRRVDFEIYESLFSSPFPTTTLRRRGDAALCLTTAAGFHQRLPDVRDEFLRSTPPKPKRSYERTGVFDHGNLALESRIVFL